MQKTLLTSRRTNDSAQLAMRSASALTGHSAVSSRSQASKRSPFLLDRSQLRDPEERHAKPDRHSNPTCAQAHRDEPEARKPCRRRRARYRSPRPGPQALPKCVTVDWMAQQWRDGKHTKKKLGAYPSMSLAQAREIFKRDFADVIQKGRSIKNATDTRPWHCGRSVRGLCRFAQGCGQPSRKETEKGLNKVADTLGRNRLARDIESEEIIELIRPIYERGAKSMADHVRSYIHAAFSWDMKSDNDYRQQSARRFRIPFNPATGIPTEPKVKGTRWLDEDEFVELYRWLASPDTPVHPPYTRAVRILMLTGQRVEEIASLHIDQWDAKEKIIDWSTTKNDPPHAVPVPNLAAELISSINVNEYGWFFPSAKDPSRPVGHGTFYLFMWRQRDRGVIPYVTNRDLRRTFACRIVPDRRRQGLSPSEVDEANLRRTALRPPGGRVRGQTLARRSAWPSHAGLDARQIAEFERIAGGELARLSYLSASSPAIDA